MTEPTNRIYKINKNINLDSDVLEAIDIERGLAKRSTYVNDILRYALLDTKDEPNISQKETTA